MRKMIMRKMIMRKKYTTNSREKKGKNEKQTKM